MALRDLLFAELVKKGYSELKDGRKVWDVANRNFLYQTDELAQAFLNLRDHPRYRATILNIEIDLLVRAVKQFASKISTNANVIDLGCGDGKKAKVFFENLQIDGEFSYVPVSVNDRLLDLSVQNVKEGNFENVLDFKPIAADLNSLQSVLQQLSVENRERNILLLLGSLLASFDIHEYLFELSNSMTRGDCLFIGNAVRTGDRFTNIENYLHPLFSEWFAPLLQEMGFKDECLSYNARFENGRVECYYSVKETTTLEYDGNLYTFSAGDEIITAVLYKYYAHELEKYCKMYFREVEMISDADEEQVLVFCAK